MTSKLRRAPLFTYNDMGTRCLASFGGTPTPPGAPPAHPVHPAHPAHPSQHQGHPGHQGYQGHPGHHGIHSHQGYATGYAGSPSANGGHTPREAPPVPLKKKPLPPLPVPQPPMECGVAGVAGSLAGSHGPHGSPAPSPLLSASPMGGPRAAERAERSPAKHGLHVNFTEKVEVKERREKFLTAKYGSHQMALIRKRLAVEMWLFDELQKLYESSESNKTDEVDVDIDELLDMDDDNQRRIHLQRILADAKKSPLDVKKFVEDLLERTKTL